jgi:hypothetical protein
MIPILHMPTMGTKMHPRRERFLDNFTAARAVLTGVVGRNSNRRHPIHFAKILYPAPKFAPRCITNRFGQVMILDHVTNLQVFQHHEVVRLHYAPCRFNGKVSTLALHFQMRSTQAVNRLATILRTFGLSANSTLHSFETLFGVPQVPRIFNGVAVRVSVEVVQAHIQTNRLFSRFPFFRALYVQYKLSVIAIATAYHSHPTNLSKLIKIQITSPLELKASGFKLVGEGDGLAVFGELLARDFVFNAGTSLVLLELGITFLAWNLLFAVIKEPRNRRPSLFSMSLSSLRVELFSPRKLGVIRQYLAVFVQVVAGHSLVVHPVSKAGITDKPSGPNRFIE